MWIQQQRVTCKKCSNVFEAEMVTDAPLAITVASMQAIRCPKCGSFECGFGGAYDDQPPLSTPIPTRAIWWISRGEVGISSRAIYSAFMGIGFREARPPVDPDDFRRCRILLTLIPEWRANLQVVANAFPVFAPFVSQWDEMDRLYDLEAPTRNCPKLYSLMRSIRIRSNKAKDA